MQKYANNTFTKISKHFLRTTLLNIWSLLSILLSEQLFLWSWHIVDVILNPSSCNSLLMLFLYVSFSIQVCFLCYVQLIFLDNFQQDLLNQWICSELTQISMLNGSWTLVLLLLVPCRSISLCQLLSNAFTSESEHWKESRIDLGLTCLNKRHIALLSNNTWTSMLDPFTWCNSNTQLSWPLFTLPSCSVAECQCFSH